MNLIERTTESANSFARDTVSTVSEVSAALAEGVVATAEGIKEGVQTGRVAPGTMFTAATLGLVAIAEWPVLVAAGGIALVASKLKNRFPDEPGEDHSSHQAQP